MMYKLFDKYYIRGLTEQDLDGPYISWFEDQEVTKYSTHGKFVKTNQEFSDYIYGLKYNEYIVWAICHDTDGHVGNAALQKISKVDRHADFNIIIGNKKHWNKGLGLATAKKIFYHGFKKINLNRIYTGCSAKNLGMINIAKKIGMKSEGKWKSHSFLNGEYHDVVFFGILNNEFKFKLG